jgi:hypothetical protein
MTQEKYPKKTGFENYVGFPMVFLQKFKGKKYCGKKISSSYNGEKGPWVTPINEKRFTTCPDGSRSCGDGICIKTKEKCPITEIKLLPKNVTADPKY